jgi:hypothetical protein
MSAVATTIAEAMQGRESSFGAAATASEPAQVGERKQRIEEISQRADQMTPAPEEWGIAYSLGLPLLDRWRYR